MYMNDFLGKVLPSVLNFLLFLQNNLAHSLSKKKKNGNQGMRGHWAVIILVLILISKLNNLRDFYQILIGWFIKLSVQTFHLILIIYRRGIFFIIWDVHQFFGHCFIPMDLRISVVGIFFITVYVLTSELKTSCLSFKDSFE